MMITNNPNGTLTITTTINNQLFKRIYSGYSRNEAKRRFVQEFNEVCKDGRYRGMEYGN